MIKEVRTNIYSNKVEKDINLIVFSDIHYCGKKDDKKLYKLLNHVKKYDVDYICIPGDLIDSTDKIDRDKFRNWINDLKDICPVIISLGNHDIRIKESSYISFYDKKYYESLSKLHNVYLLNNNSRSFNDIYFYGFTQSFDYYYLYKNESVELMKKELDEHKVTNMLPNKYRILLMHSPICTTDNDIKKKLNNYDLILCGHMHNGVIIPGIDELFNNNRGLIAPNKRILPKVSRGIVKDKNTLVISSGITKISRANNILIRWLNIFFPMGINYITITNDKNKINETFKYYK